MLKSGGSTTSVRTPIGPLVLWPRRPSSWWSCSREGTKHSRPICHRHRLDPKDGGDGAQAARGVPERRARCGFNRAAARKGRRAPSEAPIRRVKGEQHEHSAHRRALRRLRRLATQSPRRRCCVPPSPRGRTADCALPRCKRRRCARGCSGPVIGRRGKGVASDECTCQSEERSAALSTTTWPRRNMR